MLHASVDRRQRKANRGTRDRALDRAHWERTVPNKQVWIGAHRVQSHSSLGARIYRYELARQSSSYSPCTLRGPRNLLSASHFCPCNASRLDELSEPSTGMIVRDHCRDGADRSAPARHAATHDGVSNQPLGVRRRGHLRRRAFCAALVFAFSLWLVQQPRASQKRGARGSRARAAHLCQCRRRRVSRDSEHRPVVAVELWDGSAAANESIAVAAGSRNLILTLDPAAFRAAVIFVNTRRRTRSQRKSCRLELRVNDAGAA